MRLRHLTLAAAAAGAAAAIVAGPGAIATHEPADKVSAAGSETEVVGPGERVLLLKERVRTSTPSDLILGVTAECAIVTDVMTVGNDSQFAEGLVRIWIEIDGEHVPVSDEDTDEGRVVFCNRFYQRDTLNFDDEDATISTFFRTRSANAFNWMALNTGNGIHTIEVFADLVTDASSRANAEAVVGNRTLIVEPVKAANDERVTRLGN